MNKVTTLGLILMLALTLISQTFAQEVQRVRIDFTTPDGYVRHLLLAFTPDNAANDGYNYGWDAMVMYDLPNDLNWIVDNRRCVIQGVGAFENTKFYPLGLYISNEGMIKIKLDTLENFTEEIDVFVYDSLYDSYSRINDTSFENTTETGEFENRYFITFIDSNYNLEYYATQLLSSAENDKNDLSIKYLRNSGELFFNSNLINNVEELTVYNLSGQRIINQVQIQSNKIKLNLNSSNSKVYIVHLKTTEGIISKKIII